MIPVLIVPTMIHYDMLQDMLDSIDTEVNEIIIIDNGNKLKSVRCTMANKISIINMPRNLGVAGSWNLGIKLTPFAKWWLIASDDIIFESDKLKAIANSKFDSFLFDRRKDSKFSAFAVHENLIDKIGLFNEYFYPGLGEEVDYIERLYKNNIKIYNLNNFFKDRNGGSNTVRALGIGRGAEGRKLDLTRDSLRFENKDKLDYWDLSYRRYVEEILNS